MGLDFEGGVVDAGIDHVLEVQALGTDEFPMNEEMPILVEDFDFDVQAICEDTVRN